MLSDYKNSGYPHMFQLLWRANFPTEEEGLEPYKLLKINFLFESPQKPGKSKEAEESLTLKWLAVCVMLDYGNTSVRQYYSILFQKFVSSG